MAPVSIKGCFMRVFGLVLLLLGWVHAPASAQSNDAQIDMVIERLAEAYGGDRLAALETVSISTNRRLAWPGQGQTASFVEFERDRLRKHFDLVNERGSVERWTDQNGNVYHNRYVVTAKGATMIDYFDMTATPSERGGYWQWFSGDYRSSDLLMAHFLTTTAPDVVQLGTEFYRGHLHDKLAVTVSPNTPQAIVYISQRDGLIRRLNMSREIGEVSIIFSAHDVTDGVSHATEIHIYLGDTLTEYLDEFSLAVNVPLEDKIALEGGLSAPKEPVDLSEMTVDQLAPDAFVVGQGDYSLFVITDEGVVAVNAYAGLKERYEALQSFLGEEVRLTDVIATHHHSDHMDAAAEAVGLGARLHVTEHGEAYLKELGSETRDWQINVLASDDRVGPLSIYIRPTSHAVQNAFVYHPASKALFQDDHYHGLLAGDATRVQPSAVQMYAIVSALDLDIEYVLSGHARKAEAWSEFAEAATRPNASDRCPSKRAICL